MSDEQDQPQADEPVPANTAKPEPSDQQVVEELIGEETKGEGTTPETGVMHLVQEMTGADEFSHPSTGDDESAGPLIRDS